MDVASTMFGLTRRIHLGRLRAVFWSSYTLFPQKLLQFDKIRLLDLVFQQLEPVKKMRESK